MRDVASQLVKIAKDLVSAQKHTSGYSDPEGDMHVQLTLTVDKGNVTRAVGVIDNWSGVPDKEKLSDRQIAYILKNRPFNSRYMREYAERYYDISK
jgi:hypothetical protein